VVFFLKKSETNGPLFLFGLKCYTF